MRISRKYILKEIAGNFIVMPYGENNINLNSMITLNETGAFLWQQLEIENSADQLAKTLVKEYEVDYMTAFRDTEDFIEKLQTAHILD